MESEMIAGGGAFSIDVERPRKGLTALLATATVAVWSFAAVASAHAASFAVH